MEYFAFGDLRRRMQARLTPRDALRLAAAMRARWPRFTRPECYIGT